MSDWRACRAVADKILLVLQEAGKRNGKLTVLEKDLLLLYSKELTALAEALPAGEVQQQDLRPEPDEPQELSVPKTTASPELLAARTGNGHPSSRTLADRLAATGSTLNDRLRRTTTEVAERLRLTPIRDLKAYIGLNRRFAYIGLLFNDDEARYEQAIERINSFSNLEEALHYVEQELSGPLKWNMETDVVKEFLTLIRRRYLT